MKTNTPTVTVRRLPFVSTLLGAAILAAGLLSLSGADAAGDSHAAHRGHGVAATSAPQRELFHCTATVTYTKDSTVETYVKSFNLVTGAAFDDDFSVGLKQKSFTAAATQEADGVRFSFNYFNDVSALATVEADSAFTLRPSEESDDVTGHHDYYHSSVGSYDVTYTFTCERQ